jgi:hypothetical protein
MLRTYYATAPHWHVACFGIPPPNHFFLKVCGAGGDPPLKFRIGVAQGGFSALPLTDLYAKKLVCPLKLRRARKRQCQRHHLPDRDPGADREQRRDRFDAAVDPIVWIPQGPDAHCVRRAAGKMKRPVNTKRLGNATSVRFNTK